MDIVDIDFGLFTYSKHSHARGFDAAQRRLQLRNAEIRDANLKKYQDLLVTSVIERLGGERLRLLDVGGGNSRVLSAYASMHDCWNLDKLEGIGNGPTGVKGKGFRLVRDYIGCFSAEVPESYFDVVFSISALEHVDQNDRSLFDRIIKDLDRVLKPGGLSMHLFDAVVKDDISWCNPLAPYMFLQVATLNTLVSVPVIKADPDTYYMSERAYDRFWKPHTKKPYAVHGRPISLNVFWRK